MEDSRSMFRSLSSLGKDRTECFRRVSNRRKVLCVSGMLGKDKGLRLDCSEVLHKVLFVACLNDRRERFLKR